MIKLIASTQFGYYKRVDVVRNRRLVTIRGLTILPFGQWPRIWVGLAFIQARTRTMPAPGQFVKHDMNGTQYEIDYNPLSE